MDDRVALVSRFARLLRERILPPDQWKLEELPPLDGIELYIWRGDGPTRLNYLRHLSWDTFDDTELPSIANLLIEDWHYHAARLTAGHCGT